jgi:hypothetical protein
MLERMMMMMMMIKAKRMVMILIFVHSFILSYLFFHVEDCESDDGVNL